MFQQHRLTNNPNAADLILFAELKGAGPYFESVRRHPLYQEFREKCFLFSANAFVIPFLPGVYASIEKRWLSDRTRSGFYLGVSENEFLQPTPPRDDLPYLYSFVGSVVNAPIRRRLAELRHPRSFFQDTSVEYQRVLHGLAADDELRDFWKRYAEVIQASKFVLCPRGLGVSSVRLFDTMRMARVPVILSDDWVEPTGPAWREFSLRIPERDFHCIPNLFENGRSRRRDGSHGARAMGRMVFGGRLLSSRSGMVFRHQTKPASSGKDRSAASVFAIRPPISLPPSAADEVAQKLGRRAKKESEPVGNGGDDDADPCHFQTGRPPRAHRDE